MTNPLNGKYDIGVIVGRFQVPELSEGHRYLIDNVMESHKQVLIVVGVSPALNSKKNPLSYIPRMQMLQTAYPKAVVTHIFDVGCNANWSRTLDTLIRSIFPIGSVCLYGGRDSFINVYKPHGKYDTFELAITDQIAGTQIRTDCGKEVVDSIDFRKGVIYQSQNQYPKVFPTVDIAVLEKDGKEYRVLMGKRKTEDGWRFPGGFVDPQDENLESAAIRELYEEVDVEVDVDSIEYVTSNRQEDYRYQGPDEVITTTLFTVPYIFGDGKSKDLDEFVETSWILVSPWGYSQVTKNHRVLYERLMDKLKVKKTKEMCEEENGKFS